MIRRLAPEDSKALHTIIRDAVRHCVTSDETEAEFLIEDIIASLDNWFESGADGYSGGYETDGGVVGFIIVKEHWNLSHLFVSPQHQHRGIGAALLSSALASCEQQSPRSKVQLNSSENARSFYEASGFRQTGPGIDRPGGCVPYEYNFQPPTR